MNDEMLCLEAFTYTSEKHHKVSIKDISDLINLADAIFQSVFQWTTKLSKEIQRNYKE